MKNQIKILILVITVTILSSNLFSASLRYLNYSNIKNVNNYEEDLLFAINYEALFNSWIHDDYWTYDISKAECRQNLTKLYKEICDNEESANIDYLLLKSIIAEYLYNLDEPGFYDIAKDNYSSIEKLDEIDYRYYWFFGIFYVNAAKSIEGFNLLQKVVMHVPKEYIVPEFFYNYAYVANMCKMPATALTYLNKFSKYENINLSNDWLYQTVQKNLLAFDAEAIDDSCIQVRDDNGKKGFFCRPFGFFICPKGEWIPLKNEFRTPTDYFALYQSEGISTKKGNVTYSVIFSASAEENNLAENLFKSSLNKYNFEEITLIENHPELKTFKYFDKDLYKTLGGGYIIIAYFTKEYSEDADMNMEFPLDFQQLSTGDSQAHFYAMKPEICRTKNPVTYFIMLDTCDEIYEQSEKEFIEFITLSEFN